VAYNIVSLVSQQLGGIKFPYTESDLLFDDFLWL